MDVAGPQWQRCSAAKREEDATIPGAQESCESSAGTLDISLPGWADPPLQKATVYTYKQAVYADQENFNNNKKRALPWGPIQAQHQSTKLGAGGCSLISSLPAQLFPHPKGLCPSLFPSTRHETAQGNPPRPLYGPTLSVPCSSANQTANVRAAEPATSQTCAKQPAAIPPN